jgi:hypothetical protein
MQRTVLAGAAFVALVLLAGIASAAPCDGKPYCVVLADADSDGEIADDLRRARNQLLYTDPRPSPTQTAYFYAPPGGAYTWTDEVRFCGDATASPTGEDEPDCDGTDLLPTIRFAGKWSQVVLAADCPAGDETEFLITACLHVGDRLGDGGADEPPVRVWTDQLMTFRHTHVTPISIQVAQFVSAVWLDGADASLVGFRVYGDVPPSEIGGYASGSGSGVYASATNSTIVVYAETGTGANLNNALVLDGMMDGTQVFLDSDFSAAAAGPGGPSLSIGTGGLFFIGTGPRDGCDYGPDTQGTCANFTASASVATPPGMLGSDGIMVYAADQVVLDVDMEYLTHDHIPIKVDCVLWLFGSGQNCPGEVTGLTIQGDIVYDGGGVGVAVTDGDLTLDTEITLLSPGAECYAATANANVTLGPNYACNEAP